MPHQNFRYRPDIDGLRALAVIPVVLFHMGLGCPGGFIGVDIFFVISGYLITSIIIKDISNDEFSMPRFWERRIRRILPALTFVMLATILLGAFFLYPKNFKDFGQEIVAQATMVSNIYFWQQDDYFATQSELLPLLHTWSLAVEEQFYLFFPILLAFLSRKNIRHAFKWTGILLAASFVWSIYGMKVYPEATFFLLPGRAWELLIGSVIALFRYKKTLPYIANEILSWLGVALIFYSIIFYDTQTPFPGPAALLPCLGAALLIFCNHQKLTSSAKILALPPFVFIGKISYSLYLWHWPLMVYTRYASNAEPSLSIRISLVIASTILAYISWKYVESPFRKHSPTQVNKRVFRAFYICTGVSILIGAVLYKGKGIPARFSDDVLAYTNVASEKVKIDKADILKTNTLPLIFKPKENQQILPILVWGDSHTRCMAPVLRDICKESNTNLYVATHGGAPPILDVNHPKEKDLPENNAAVMAFIKNKKITDVLLVCRWSYYALGVPSSGSTPTLVNPLHPELPPKVVFKTQFNETIKQLKEAGVQVWIMKQVPLQDTSAPEALANALRFGYNMNALGIPKTQHIQRQSFVNEIFESLVDESIHVIDPLPYLSSNPDVCNIEKNGKSLYRDENHLSIYGALQLKPLIAPILEKASSNHPTERPND